ncbi:Hypothetical protein SMB2099_3836 [Serratia marcescens SMB2099]|nr:Hypothetical protein SMB2099_3836 [Serratia marcescens SMB2099]
MSLAWPAANAAAIPFSCGGNSASSVRRSGGGSGKVQAWRRQSHDPDVCKALCAGL